MYKRSRKKNSGFTTIEVLATIVILTILLTIFVVVFKEGIKKSDGTMTCVEWEDAHMTDCWSYGMGTQCESYVEKRCVKYEYDDGSGEEG